MNLCYTKRTIHQCIYFCFTFTPMYSRTVYSVRSRVMWGKTTHQWFIEVFNFFFFSYLFSTIIVGFFSVTTCHSDDDLKCSKPSDRVVLFQRLIGLSRVSLIHIWMFFLLIYFSFLFLFADEGEECPSLQYFIDDCNIVNNYADLGADGYKDLFTGACNRHQLCYTCVSCIQTYRIFSKPRLCVRAQTFRERT